MFQTPTIGCVRSEQQRTQPTHTWRLHTPRVVFRTSMALDTPTPSETHRRRAYRHRGILTASTTPPCGRRAVSTACTIELPHMSCRSGNQPSRLAAVNHPRFIFSKTIIKTYISNHLLAANFLHKVTYGITHSIQTQQCHHAPLSTT